MRLQSCMLAIDIDRGVVNRHGRLVFPANFFVDLDFSVMKSLDLAPKMKVGKETIEVSNYTCSFLRDALKRGLPGPLICDALCGDKHPSLFLGLLWPFPWRIKYEVTSRMGDGGPHCQRVFTARSPDSSPPSP